MKIMAFLLLVLLQVSFTGATFAAQPVVKSNMSAFGPSLLATEEALSELAVAFGVYDPHREFAKSGEVAIEHIFIAWYGRDVRELPRKLAEADRMGRTMMVTVEPYMKPEDWNAGGKNLFKDIVNGRFDGEIESVCSQFARFKGRLLVRWGHEMEAVTGRYPWARKDNEGFKSAFRHFVTQCRHHAPRVAFVWSPRGEENLADYYPGDEWVDYVGVSLWALQKMDIDYFGGSRKFLETFREKYNRVSVFSKPVIIAELGVSGDDRYRQLWFSSLFNAIAEPPVFEKLQAVVYFNDKEPDSWPQGYGSPDWRIPDNWFSMAKQLTQELHTSGH